MHAWDVIPSVTLVTFHRILAPVYSFTAHTAGILWCSGTRIRRNISRQQYQEIEKSGASFGMCRVILRGKYGTCSANTTLQGLDSLSSLWPEFTLTVHINALYNESIHGKEEHAT